MDKKFPLYPDDFEDLNEGMGPPSFTCLVLGSLGLVALVFSVAFGLQLLAGYVISMSAVPACSFPLPAN
ncbi:hypothetical protein [Thalassobius sp. Cn5-15]|uniref:hypothetical protein n=1 Tax=Thalassobius sp. Cn5-15 TaxID=2917763 RepID=UPI001EF3B465|nr:hypothetical protein [Thalassobius sp. Cn5-15]MCG7492413.1 hypothetical protein [Thalassobius sp. Cn5-15]